MSRIIPFTMTVILIPALGLAAGSFFPVVPRGEPRISPWAAEAPAGSLTLTMNIVGQRKGPDGSYTEVLVHEGSVLHSYDHFQVHMETNRPAYVYILLYDSQGKARQLFPHPKIDHPDFVKPGNRVVAPAEDLWYWLDEKAGTETLYVLASEKPMADIRELLAGMEAADERAKRRISTEMRQRIAQRGLAVVAKGEPAAYSLSDGKRIRKVTEVVTGSGSVVRALSFQHR
ncbi:MAG TPA: DUF4384 domain-containing protein [Candidatus Binatia bacterium]